MAEAGARDNVDAAAETMLGLGKSTLFWGERVAKPLWYKIFAQGDYPLFDRLQAFFSANPNFAEDRGVARLLTQLTNPATRAETPLQTDPAISITLLPRTSETSGRPYIVPTPEVDAFHDVVLPEGRSAGPSVPAELDGEADSRLFALQVGMTVTQRLTGTRELIGTVEFEKEPPEFGGGWAADYMASHPFTIQPRAEFDVVTLPDSANVTPDAAEFDTMELSGDFSQGLSLSDLPFDVEQVAVLAGSDYVLSSDDDYVGAGESLTVDGSALGEGNHIDFDGGAETDGRFSLWGGDSNDRLTGGAGDDVISGGGGADVLTGGGGADLFIYRDPGDSTGTDYDTLADFDAAADRINLPGDVSGFAAPVESGALSLATFNADLAAALGSLGASQAAWFAPDSGELAGQIFLVVDGNGKAGYQEGEDYVFAVTGAPLADLAGHTDIFI
jgi:hypothetical protein